MIPASKIRAAALALLREHYGFALDGAQRYELFREGLTIATDADPDDGRCRLTIESEGRRVFAAWWEPGDPDESIAAVTSHGPWQAILIGETDGR
jgi:hypothetical protein